MGRRPDVSALMTDVLSNDLVVAASSVERPRCLVVDDEAPLRRVITKVMKADGFEVEEAENGQRAMEALTRFPATIVLSDLHMPELDGIGLLRHCRQNYPECAVVMITAVSDVRTAVECLGQGAMDYLTKPFHVEEVRARVKQVLDKRRLVLENREYHERLEERVAIQARRIEELFLASIQSLADTLEVRDTYTYGHSIRVSRYSALIARELGMAPEDMRAVELGGRVHDVGKIGVREAVLNKSGPLTDEEYQHVMAHPMTGWRILQPLLKDHPVALNIVRNHHERWDGTGLPDRLAAESIPFEARIAAVADTFDAMTSRRPYRPGVPLDATVAELKRCRSTQFDSRVVDAFVALVGRGEIQRISGGA
jgi:response regulator RpfG family c-di-GMP phosphodiesterase